MGYLCPVCEEPFGDEAQCANHLAVTAILHGEAHDQWLAEAVDERDDGTDDWESVPRADLAAIVAERAAETTDHDHPGDHTHPVDNGGDQPVDNAGEQQQPGQPAITESPGETEALDADAQSILNEARELTRKMQQRGPDADTEDESKET
ncbi:hypothetical protein halTADL_3274 [Halohasta litchfieldiae]|jgi:hypothetical protein|uniref:C2H2-type domain-containing protein n=1 Tax=Halohasta litchfieldiae TaxID=1073996 RepID=A0A1H6SC23_9EURY|nr:DUF5810 domain-containing protein [Halohasta litchfieldiae]ATW89976.1 hypothetical protein halTADL_3274 [Halohasta litchfieldiae]SEI65688.1 hypothetical protein SAMN05444271_10513 [Halohasta litchfieldiae]